MTDQPSQEAPTPEQIAHFAAHVAEMRAEKAPALIAAGRLTADDAERGSRVMAAVAKIWQAIAARQPWPAWGQLATHPAEIFAEVQKLAEAREAAPPSPAALAEAKTARALANWHEPALNALGLPYRTRAMTLCLDRAAEARKAAEAA